VANKISENLCTATYSKRKHFEAKSFSLCIGHFLLLESELTEFENFQN